MNKGVQGKIPCIFETVVEDLPSRKRTGQNYRVVATKELSQKAILSGIETATATEKLDGTCCYVREYKGCFTLWARLDRKPNKKSDKRYKKFQTDKRQWSKNGSVGEEPTFVWKYPDDFKEVPDCWIPALNVHIDPENGYPVPDENGHIPGWVPISYDKRQYCWHHTVVDDQNQFALLLRGGPNLKESGEDSDDSLKIVVTALSELDGLTLELIGTNINGNPYGLGNKQNPMHLLVIHGDIKVQNIPAPLNYEHISEWFSSKHDKNNHGNVEGVVWHCKDNCMYKVHRNHLGLRWPLTKSESGGENSAVPWLCRMPVRIVSHLLHSDNGPTPIMGQFVEAKRLHFESYASIHDVPWDTGAT